MDKLIPVLIMTSVLRVTFVTSAAFNYDPNFLVPTQCKACDAKSCPQLTYCAGEVVKDHCGCCERCSSDLFQPHVDPFFRESDISTTPTVSLANINSDNANACEKRQCPKFKVCAINVQGLPICTCPSEFICRRRGSRKSPNEPTEICGTDGVTYESRCHLKIANCNSDRRIKRKHDGKCQENASNTNLINTPDLDTASSFPTLFTGTSTSNAENSVTKSDRKKRLKKKKKKQRRKERQRQKKERKKRRQKKGKKNKGKKKNLKKRKRSNRMKRRNEGYYMLPSNYDYLIGRQTKWSRSQVRKSQI